MDISEFEKWGNSLMEQYVQQEKEVELSPFYHPCSNEQKLIDSIEKTHPQLSPLLLFNMSVILGRRLGILNIIPKAGGKTTLCKTLTKYFNSMELDVVSKGIKRISNKKITLIIHDLATALQSGMETFQILTPLIYDKSINTGTYLIKNTDLVIIGAGTPTTLKTLFRHALWEAQVADRFLRLYYFYYNKPDRISQTLPKTINIRFSKNPTTIDVKEELLNRCTEMLEYQLTHERASLACNAILRGHASLCNRDTITNDDAKWLLTYSPFITIEMLFNIREDLSERRYDFAPFNPIVSFNEILYAVCKRGEMKITELRKFVKGVSKHRLKYILKKLSQVGIAYDDERVIIKGRLKAELKRVYETFH